MAQTKATAKKRVRTTTGGSQLSQTVIRRSVSLDRDVDALAHELVGDANFSSFVNDAMREKARHVQMTRLLDDLDSEFGAVDHAVEQKVSELWRTASRSTRAR